MDKSIKNRFKFEKRTPMQHTLRFLLLILICFVTAASYYCFVTPNHFAPGGIYGIGTMIEGRTGFPMGYSVLIISVPLLIACFIFLNFESALNVALLAILTNGMEIFMAKLGFYQFIADDRVMKIFAAIIGGAMAGGTFGYTIKYFGIADGTIAISTIIKKKRPQTNIAWATFAFDTVVVASSLFVYWGIYTKGAPSNASMSTKITMAIEPLMYSFVNMFIVSKMCDVILRGIVSAYKFEVITDRPEELSKEIFEKLERGVTAITAKGMYSKNDKTILLCIVRKRQIGEFQKIIKKFDGAFAYIASVSEVMGYFSK